MVDPLIGLAVTIALAIIVILVYAYMTRNDIYYTLVSHYECEHKECVWKVDMIACYAECTTCHRQENR